MTTTSQPFATAPAVLAFVMGGNATVTLVSLKTGTRFTYKIQMAESGTDAQSDLYFVKVLRGADNESDYSYLGRIAKGHLILGRKTPRPGDVGPGAPSALAFAFAWDRITKGHIPATLEVWHEGRCGRCNRKLTVPESVASGFGPECINHVHQA
jgi:hypothetical protein